MVFVSKSYEDVQPNKITALSSGNEVLDIGFTELPNIHFKNQPVVGLDLESPKSPSGYSREIIGDAKDVEHALPGRQFDTIVASEIIVNLVNPYAFIRALTKVLLLGGRINIRTHNPGAPSCIFFEWPMSQRFFTLNTTSMTSLPGGYNDYCVNVA